MKRYLGRILIAIICAGVLMESLVSDSNARLFAKEETPGERFRKALEKIKANCEGRKLARGEVCGEVAKLKPADPLATEEGRFAHSIKIPNPVPEDSGYKPGMTPEQYFEHLCKTEAGEFIYKTVENVEGLLMMRPRKEATDWELEHLYALEDPYGQVMGEDHLAQDAYVQPAIGKYRYLELPILEGDKIGNKYTRFYRSDSAHSIQKFQTVINGKFVMVPYLVTEAHVPIRKSRYGYTWRGVRRPHDRELGIVGGELIILDLETNEVIAVRRGYLRSGWMKNLTGIWWLKGQACPKTGGKREHLFVKEVLKPLPELSLGKEK
ncbi:MAG: hypothetical protein KF814_05040 [Nitrospiraceae bacterium]|nr:hypothetical protein [Nitrospiraceae bacterium]